MASNPLEAPPSYGALLRELQERIRGARLRAALAVNQELVTLYWSIGADILARQRSEGWGAKVIDRLAEDLRRTFPEMTGLSARNLKYMRAFAEAYPDFGFVQQVVARLPWGHNVRLLEAVKDPAEREWYARQAIENGWSRNVLAHQIASGLYERQGRALTNFARTLPAERSELAQQIIKDPYSFDFLSLGPDMLERDLERGLIEHLRALILELGKGFAFVGSQYHLEIGGQDYYLDLLFYHLRLRCFVVIELKMEEFKPEFAGKMNFYLSAVDDRAQAPRGRPEHRHHPLPEPKRGGGRVRAAGHQQADGGGALPPLASAAGRAPAGAADRRGAGARVPADVGGQAAHRDRARAAGPPRRTWCDFIEAGKHRPDAPGARSARRRSTEHPTAPRGAACDERGRTRLRCRARGSRACSRCRHGIPERARIA